MPSRRPITSPIAWISFALLLGSLAFAPVKTQAQQQPSPEAMARAIAEAKAFQLPDDPAAVIAVVGTSQILLGDIKPKVDAMLDEALSKSGQEIPEDILIAARVNFTRRLLGPAIQSKQMRESFLLEQVGTQGADKRREAAEMMASRARQMFYESEVAELKKKFDVNTLPELDEKMRENGSSLKARERDFMDAMLGHMFMRSSINKEPNVTLSEINTHYITHKDEYYQTSRAKWEQFTVLFANHPSRDAAMKKIWEMGRETYFGGKFAPVAKSKSEEPFAAEGGLHDWTNQGSLASKKLDQQIFSLPLNEMSDIIEDETGLHIVRVLAREDAGVQPLSDVQESIKEKLKQEKIAIDEKAMVKKMREQVPVWSIFPDDIPGARPLNVPSVATLPNARNYK
ncbi:MAG: peptidyl-prolyl cis-trans isomerase [Pirellulaceae bacterium]